MEPIHKARIFDIAAGMGVSLESSITTVNARSLELLKRSKESFRNFIDSATPSIYVIDINKDVVLPLIEAYNLTVPSTVLEKEILEAIDKIVHKVSVEDFTKVIEDANTKASTKLKVLGEGKSSHLEYRNVFYTLGKDISVLFNTRVNLILTNPEKIGLPNKFVFIGKSFEGIKGNLNKAINSVLRKYTEDKKASYGNVMAAGHTSVALPDNTYGTNTPATQEALFKLEAAGVVKSNLIEFNTFTDEFVKKVPLFINSSITFSENFTPTAKTLLNIGFTFIVPMDTIANSASGSAEVKAIKDLIGTIVIPGIAEAMKSRLTWLKNSIKSVRGSPTIPEYIASVLAATIVGTKASTSVYSDTKSTKINLPSLALPKIKLKLNKNPNSSKVIVTNSTLVSEVSLSSLLAYINRYLQHVVSGNMGDGNESRILNFRTGRFAASAKVERLSESRAGMITAFYSYMKNPYQTFEPGFAQGKPDSRDPKLLLSTSIREIAATKVGNRLRAISV
jgi:hypothetical protein